MLLPIKLLPLQMPIYFLARVLFLVRLSKLNLHFLLPQQGGIEAATHKADLVVVEFEEIKVAVVVALAVVIVIAMQLLLALLQ